MPDLDNPRIWPPVDLANDGREPLYPYKCGEKDCEWNDDALFTKVETGRHHSLRTEVNDDPISEITKHRRTMAEIREHRARLHPSVTD